MVILCCSEQGEQIWRIDNRMQIMQKNALENAFVFGELFLMFILINTVNRNCAS